MEQIVKLLVAMTIATIFSLVIIYYFAVFSKNGGEYWGFDGQTEPSIVAAASFEASDYRFLVVKQTKPFGGKVFGAPNTIGCTFHDQAEKDYLRETENDFDNSVDSTQTALAFARSYNQRLSGLLIVEFPTECGHQARTKPSVIPNYTMH